MQEMLVSTLGWEGPLEEEMATHSSILARRFPWTEEPGRLQSIGSQRVRHDYSVMTIAHCSQYCLKSWFSEFYYHYKLN